MWIKRLTLFIEMIVFLVEIILLAKMGCSFCEMNENFDHQHQDLRTENAVKYGDLPEFMDFEYLRKIAASI
jgi:hypothetical protein